MSCVTCGKEVDVEFGYGHVLLNCDGDFACSQRCAEKYKTDRDNFFANIHDDAWYERWLAGKEQK